MTEGEQFNILEGDNEGWTLVQRLTNGEEGFVPSSFLGFVKEGYGKDKIGMIDGITDAGPPPPPPSDGGAFPAPPGASSKPTPPRAAKPGGGLSLADQLKGAPSLKQAPPQGIS